MVADPTSANTAPETLRAVLAHGLLPVIVRELTEPTPYGPDGDEGDGCDADLEEKLMRCVLWFKVSYVSLIDKVLMIWICRLLHTYVSAHNGTFDDPEKNSLRTFLDARRATPGELGLGADELREIRNALA
jgi:hsp70-interacting protein